ncbi:MAG: hypothetical protein FWH27_04805 [Planctomycetaceae bacterium]|nr:hypothetical protein [Planctomycetaceae bacterium]
MNKTRFVYFSLCAVLFLAVFPGCGGKKKPDGLPALYPCEIKVMQDGAPLAGAIVSLVLTEGSNKWGVSGGTNDQGVAKVYTHGDFAGAPAGQYKVLITKTVIEDAPTQEQLNNPNYAGPMGTDYDYIDLQYKSLKSTPLTIEITSGKNTKDFDVGKAIREKVTIR